MVIQLLVDNPKSWIVPYVFELQKRIKEEHKDYEVNFLSKHEEVQKGDILCLLSCERVFRKLDLNRHNIVVHESDLPKGKGWSPMTWQVLEGKKRIPITLFEANEKIDAGKIYLQKHINLKGHELVEEIRHEQGIATIQIILEFLKNIQKIQPLKQQGEETFYRKRTPKDSELNVDKSIKEQFNLLRVCDNERYPAFFLMEGNKYVIKIEKEKI